MHDAPLTARHLPKAWSLSLRGRINYAFLLLARDKPRNQSISAPTQNIDTRRPTVNLPRKEQEGVQVASHSVNLKISLASL